ncbi:hypothetical protein H8E77_42475 [bacterium]|nr:hypothetical protein [bacterium]
MLSYLMSESQTIKYGMATLIYRNNVRYAQRLLREPPDYGTWKAVRNSLWDRVSCGLKSLTVKGGLMVVNVFPVMGKAWRRRLSRAHQLSVC